MPPDNAATAAAYHASLARALDAGAAVLLTSHYMDDVVALCPRIVVIDRGRLIYEGDLRELVRRVRPDKHVTIRFSKPVDKADLARLGTVVSADAAQAVISVPAAQASAVRRNQTRQLVPAIMPAAADRTSSQ